MASLIDSIAKHQNTSEFKELNWTGSLDDYLAIVKKSPAVCRSSFQRIHDMILSYGWEEYVDNKKKIIHYNFFDDPTNGGYDSIYGLDIPLMKLVHTLKAAAHGFGPEKRIILLHGPVGSAKSTIVRLIKKGLEAYSRTDEGALYTYEWLLGDGKDEVVPSPMHEDPLKLIPMEWRSQALSDLNPQDSKWPVSIEGELNPHCRFVFQELMRKYDGDWAAVVRDHVRVRRLVFSEQDRVGIGTFQPKDEKNQDSTELTGDIN